MAQKTKVKSKNTTVAHRHPGKTGREKKQNLLLWWLIPAAITFVCFIPMLQNGFTNWDDEDYVVKNIMVKAFDLKEIFSGTVNGNYHPLTMLSLALNYQMTQLNASSYLITNLLIHLANTGLVFYFIWLISGKRKEVAFFTALVFGIHPMHVESVAWVSERKDVLYTFFFLISLIQYWRFLETNDRKKLWLCFFWFALSLLSKPAAIILPFVLLLLDYWKGRTLSWKLVVEKIPFFIAAILFGIITLQIQSHSAAIVKLDSYPLWTRPLLACYTLMIYLVRFIFPYPLSTLHPYPEMDHLSITIMLSPLFVIALAIFLWTQRKKRVIIFSLLFVIVNLLLILQVISIGSSIVSERYTYIPYIGIAFGIGMLLFTKREQAVTRRLLWISSFIVTAIFGLMTFERTKVWKDASSLWTNVIEHYPTVALARTNRANYLINLATANSNKSTTDSLYQLALEDCNVAIQNHPDNVDAYSNRQNIYLNLFKDKEALADAETIIKLDPDHKVAYFTKGAIEMRNNQPGQALSDFNKAISLDPRLDYAYNYRGTLYMNVYKKYNEALADFNRSIELNPEYAYYYLSRSYCYYFLGNIQQAKNDANTAKAKGMNLPDDYKRTLNL